LRGIALGPLVQAIINKELISAKAEVVADITTQGLDPDSLLQHLSGEARVQLDKTQLVNLDLRNWLLGGFYDQLHQPRPAADTKEHTVFDALRASLTIHDGVITNRDLLATTAKDKLTGSGQIDLPAQTIDYTVSLTRTAPFVVSLGDNDIDLKDEPIAIPIRGAWKNLPVPKPDVLALVKRLQQRALENKKAAVKEKVEKKLETEVKDKLKKFLNR
jgi:AsmA protein